SGTAEGDAVRRRVRRRRSRHVRAVVPHQGGGVTRINRAASFLLPLVGVGLALLAWGAASLAVPDLPSPHETWRDSRIYILEPLTKRGEMDQGILLLAYYSLIRVTRGFL